MKLNLMERFTVLQILPTEGNFATLNIVRKLQEALAPTEDEYTEFGIKGPGEEFIEEDGTVTIIPEDKTRWNTVGAEEREIEVGEKASDIVVEALNKLDKEKKLTPQHLTVYEKFVKNKD